MSDTPRSDAHYGVLGIKQVRGAEHDLIFARQLERELAAVTSERDRWHKELLQALNRAEKAEDDVVALRYNLFRGSYPTDKSIEDATKCIVERDALRLQLASAEKAILDMAGKLP